MNRPSRDDDGEQHPGWNQSPPALSRDTTTRQDLIGTVNARSFRDHKLDDGPDAKHPPPSGPSIDTICPHSRVATLFDTLRAALRRGSSSSSSSYTSFRNRRSTLPGIPGAFQNILRVLLKYARYIGPGALMSVAFADPGNYITDIAAGVTYRFKLLFVVLFSNLIAIFLQSLCVRIGCVTGKTLAQLCKIHFPRWLNLFIYVFAEAAIIATDIAEVIGTAIALNLLFHIPLVAGCAISILDVMVILLVYRPNGSMRTLRVFELFVLALVLGVVICFCFQLSLITDTSVGDVFKGYLPSSAVVQSQGLYQSIGILGATVMPHSLYLGTGIVQPRLFELDRKTRAAQAITSPSEATLASTVTEVDSKPDLYTSSRPPLLSSIRSCISYSTAELIFSLATFALFINSALLIIAGAELYAGPNNDSESSLFAIHDLLSTQVSKVAGVVFALALLLSGTSAGIVCTIAGQIVSEGHLRWDWVGKPWVRRLITRSIAITPSIIIAGTVGSKGLTTALEASQVALSIILPVVSGPVIWFTCFGQYMVVKAPVPEPSTACMDSAPSVPCIASEPSPVESDKEIRTAVQSTSDPSHQSPKARAPHLRSTPKSESAPDTKGLATSAPRIIAETRSDDGLVAKDTNMRNHWLVTVLALAIWCLVVIANIAALVFLGK